jgi:hypothetical protein
MKSALKHKGAWHLNLTSYWHQIYANILVCNQPKTYVYRPQLELFTTLNTRRRFSYLIHTQLKQTYKKLRKQVIYNAR